MSTRQARWFHLKLNRRNAPFLFVKGEPFKTIASSELLAVTVALMVFGPKGHWRRGAGRVVVTGLTDNLSNSYLIDKFLSTKFPVSLVLMELAKQLERYEVDLDLTWIPREQNETSHNLSKGRYEKFDMANRIEVLFEEMDFLILKMFEAAQEMDAEVVEKTTSKSSSSKLPPEQKLRLVQPW